MTIFHVIKYPINKHSVVTDYVALPEEIKAIYCQYVIRGRLNGEQTIEQLLTKILLEYNPK
jgi:hypothetical protein